MFLMYLMSIDDEAERKSIEELYKTYKYQCFYMALKRINDKAAAEDIVQETFVQIIKHRKRYLKLSPKDFERLLVIIVRNKVIDYVRKEKPDVLSLEDDAACYELISGETLPEDIVISRQEFELAREAISRLDEMSRIILEYKYLLDASYEEIADMTGMKCKTVEMRLYRARKKIKEMMEQNGVTI